MAERNQEVLDMIRQLRARLKDLEQEVLAFEGELPSLPNKLDRIDDQLYLLVAELEQARDAGTPEAAEKAGSPVAGSASEDASRAEGSGQAAPASRSAADNDEDDNGLNILTPEAKQKLGETVGDMREIGRDAAAAFTELNEAFADITEPFKAFTKPGRRR